MLKRSTILLPIRSLLWSSTTLKATAATVPLTLGQRFHLQRFHYSNSAPAGSNANDTDRNYSYGGKDEMELLRNDKPKIHKLMENKNRFGKPKIITPPQDLVLISFYKYRPLTKEEMEKVQLRLWKFRDNLGVLGRCYVYFDGMNCQISVPKANLKTFFEELQKEPIFKDVEFNCKNVMDKNKENVAPFSNMHVRLRPLLHIPEEVIPYSQPEDQGARLTAKEWNELLSKENTLIFDARNWYESMVGKFEGATPLNTDSFYEAFSAIEKMLNDKDKENTNVMMYCTGGIRCVRLSAYVKQKLGFKNVYHLKGGIVNYSLEIEEESIPSKFIGKNFVFDERRAEKVTDDVIATCSQCGTPCDTHVNCPNTSCNLLFVQCPTCASKFNAACSDECKRIIELPLEEQLQIRKSNPPSSDSHKISYYLSKIKSLQQLQREIHTSTVMDGFETNPKQKREKKPFTSVEIENYCVNMSSSVKNLEEIRLSTEKQFPQVAHQMITPYQAAFLQMLVIANKSKSILELGTFTGYSALAMASVLPSDGHLITCELNPDISKIAEENFEKSGLDSKITLKNQSVQSLLEEIVNAGEGKNLKKTFDLIFLDANKSDYVDYLQTIIENRLLNSGGLLVVDNVLWRGEVISPISSMAFKMHEFNTVAASYPDLDKNHHKVLLPIGDGLFVISRHT